jgi:hypothetical protein
MFHQNPIMQAEEQVMEQVEAQEVNHGAILQHLFPLHGFFHPPAPWVDNIPAPWENQENQEENHFPYLMMIW